jgi:hypothetical protein
MAEREVSPGIYITDFRRDRDEKTHVATSPSPPSSYSYQQEHKQHDSSNPSSSSFSSSSSTSSYQPAEHVDVNQLAWDLSQLQNSIDHLLSSNVELLAVMEQEGDDADGTYSAAVRENEQVIQRKQRQADEMQRIIDDALAGHGLDHRHSGRATSPSPAPSSAASQAEDDSSGGMQL